MGNLLNNKQIEVDKKKAAEEQQSAKFFGILGFIVLAAIIVIFATAPKTNTSATTKTTTSTTTTSNTLPDYFVELGSYKTKESSITVTILYDKETGVMYSLNSNGVLSPLYSADGSLKIHK